MLTKELTGPYEGKAVRLPVYPPVGLTGLTGARATYELPGPNRTATTARGIMLRDPVMPHFHDFATDFGGRQAYQAVYSCTGRGMDSTEEFFGQVADLYYTSNTNLSELSGQVGISGPNGSMFTTVASWVPFMTDGSGLPYLYVPTGFYLTAVLMDSLGDGEYVEATVDYEIFTAPGEADTLRYNMTPIAGKPTAYHSFPGFGTPATIAGWVRPKAIQYRSVINTGPVLTQLIALVVTSGVATVTAPVVFPRVTVAAPSATTTSLLPVPSAISDAHLRTLSISWENCLTHSVHLSLENSTKVTEKEGRIEAAKFSLDAINPWAAVSATKYNSIPPNKRYFRAAEHGLRAYVEPGAKIDFRQRLYSYNSKDSGTLVQVPMLNLQVGDFVNLYDISDVTPASAMSFAATLDYCWEFLTQYSTVPLARTNYLLADMERALLDLAVRNPFSKFETGSVLQVTGPGTKRERVKEKGTKTKNDKPKTKVEPKAGKVDSSNKSTKTAKSKRN